MRKRELHAIRKRAAKAALAQRWGGDARAPSKQIRVDADAAAFNAAIIGQAFALGFYAEPSAKWEDGLDGENGCRLVSVFVAAADYMTDDGHAVA